MTFIKGITYGVETKIALIQQYIQSKLEWFTANGGALANAQVLIFGKVYNNPIGEESQPEVSALNSETKIADRWHDAKEYQDVLNSDKTAVQIAFHVTGRDIVANWATIDVIFSISDLGKVYDNNLYEDERAILDATRLLKECSLIEEVTDLKVGVEDVFEDFDFERRKYTDLAPFQIFSVTIETPYQEDSCKVRPLDIWTADDKITTVDNNTVTIDQLVL